MDAMSSTGGDSHNSATCSEVNGGGKGGATNSGGGGKGFMLFGVRLMEGGSFRKCASMNNLSQYDNSQDSNGDVAAGYESDDVVHPSERSRERKRGVAWTEEEHKLFLLGLQRVGKGDWRGISRNFVKTRTPTQVASHAQKYFLRKNNHNRRRRRSSLFDITTETVLGSSKEDQAHQETLPNPQMLHQNIEGYPMPCTKINLTPPPPPPPPIANENIIEPLKLVRPIPLFPIPPSSKMANLNLNKSTITDPLPLTLSLKLSTPSLSTSDHLSPPKRHVSAFQGMPSRSSNNNNGSGDSIISVA